MKHTARHQVYSGRKTYNKSKQHKQISEKYQHIRGEMPPVCGGSLKELERRLDAASNHKQEEA